MQEKYQAKLSQLQEEKSKEMDRFKDVTDAIMTYAEGIDCHMRKPSPIESDEQAFPPTRSRMTLRICWRPQIYSNELKASGISIWSTLLVMPT